MESKVKAYLIKWGNNVSEVNKMMELHFNNVMQGFPKSTAKHAATLIRTLY